MKITTKITIATYVDGENETAKIEHCYTQGAVKMRAFQTLLNSALNNKSKVVSVRTLTITCNCKINDTVQHTIEGYLTENNIPFDFALDNESKE